MTKVSLVGFLIWVCACPGLSREPQDHRTRLDTPVENYTVSETNRARALIQVASRFQIPMGIEWIEPAAPEGVNLSWTGVTVRKIIESVVRGRPGYAATFEGRMVHVFYEGARADKANFLNMTLHGFKVQDEHVGVALYDLHQVVVHRVSPQNECCVFHQIMLEPNDHLISLEFHNPTVREVLDQLTLASGSKIWAVTFREGPGLTPTGSRRTRSLWNDHLISDNDQPVWDRFPWGLLSLPAGQRQKAARAR
jgi:hypothetical protein